MSRNIIIQLFSIIYLLLLLLLVRISNAGNHNIIKSIPGFPGNLPFHLETGYVGVGEMEEVQLFYYFSESERDPLKDPLLLWLTGGPGCSSLSGLALQIGPVHLDTISETDTASFQLNPYSWTKVASMVFLDVPVGTGFSYSTTDAGYNSSDLLQSYQIYQFLQKWLVDHVEFKDVPLYISGDSYCGKIVPVVTQNIINGNKADTAPRLNLKGYILGNPVTGAEDGTASKIKYAERVSLISTEQYESTIYSCNGTYEDADVDCRRHLQTISNNLDWLNAENVLMPNCEDPQTRCQKTNYDLLSAWANTADVRLALQIREGTKRQWIRCNRSLAYESNVESTVVYHQSLAKEPLRALVYSGDQDMSISYVGTLKWILGLHINILDDWRPWLVNSQIAGYITKFWNGHYDLTYATVKGAGHIATVEKPQECLAMISKWLAMDPV